MLNSDVWLQMCATIAALLAIVAGYGAKPTRVQRAEMALKNAEVGSKEAENAYKQLKAALARQQEDMKKLNKHSVSVAKLALETKKPAVAKKLSKLDEEEAADDAAPAEDGDAAPVEDDEAATEDSGVQYFIVYARKLRASDALLLALLFECNRRLTGSS